MTTPTKPFFTERDFELLCITQNCSHMYSDPCECVIAQANAKVEPLLRELEELRKENAELKIIPENVVSISEGKRMVCLLQARVDKLKAALDTLKEKYGEK